MKKKSYFLVTENLREKWQKAGMSASDARIEDSPDTGLVTAASLIRQPAWKVWK